MTIDEAIKILEEATNPDSFAQYGALQLAERLGIEALKAYQKSQANGWYPPGYRLPGETEE